jgi:transposase
MAEYPELTELLNLTNFKVVHYQLVGQNRVNLFIEPIVDIALCPECHQASTTVHDTSEPQMIRDLSIWDRRCWLRLTPRRFECATCQKTYVERLAWREPGRDYTLRYEQYIYQRTRKEPILQIAQDEKLSEEAVQGIFERWAKKRSPNAAGRS